jgi:hypothetical protein
VDLGNLNPQEYLQGVNWPAEKQEIVDKAENNGAPQGLLDQLKNLGGGKFSGPQEVMGKL